MLWLLFLQNARLVFSPSTSSPQPNAHLCSSSTISPNNQTHDKPTAKHLKTPYPQIPQSKLTIPTIPTNQQTSSSLEQIYNKYYITETFEPWLIFGENATSTLLAPYSPTTAKEVDSMLYMTEIFKSEKKKKKRKNKKKNLVAKLTSLPLLPLFSCFHLTSPIISLYYSSFLSLPYLSISSPSSHVLSHTTILYFSFILCGSCGLLVYEPPNISCEFMQCFETWNNFLKF